MQVLKYSAPSFFCLVFIVLAHFHLLHFFFLILLLLRNLNPIFGEYSEADLRKELVFFYSSSTARYIKIVNALFLTGFNIWVLFFIYSQPLSVGELALFLFAMTIINGCFSLSLAHDLEHSSSKLSLFTGNLLLFWVCLPFFREDHIYGHHALVGTEEDQTSARLNQSFYKFIRKAFIQRIGRCYFQKGFLSEKNRKEIWLFTYLLGGFSVILFLIDPLLLCFWLGQASLVYILHELTNYVQHYGLHRHINTAVSLQHSWNSFYKYANCILYFLPVHSAHHVGKPLNEMPSIMGPKLPFSLLECTFLALMPRFWFLVMNPLVADVEKAAIAEREQRDFVLKNNEITVIY